jgi:hypothetical protein
MRRTGRGLPERFSVGDIALLGVATHKLSRTIAKEKVAAPIRAPFTEYEHSGAPGEVEERPRGSGPRRAVGELLACPYCISQWVGTAFAAGLVVTPRLTRFIAAIFSGVAITDFLQLLYRAADRRL